MIYLDTSAAVKLVLPEAETPALETWVNDRAGFARVSSPLLRIELLRAVTRNAADRLARAQEILSGVVLLSMDDAAPAAEVIGDSQLRSLDAIHLASAHAVRSALTALVTYDKRMVTAAAGLGLPVVSPG
ncbi:MAG TPA: type II toxin-antitoxin system VapC family toxin [Amycolatopsis sp.]|nr:type II toxin-antitoxin system VapC family toxin [Amycolatopsis sp.]